MKRFISVLMLVCIMASFCTVSAFAADIPVTNQADFEAAISSPTSGDTIILEDGEYNMVGNSTVKTVTIKGKSKDGVIVNFPDGLPHFYGELNMSNLTINCVNKNYTGLAHLSKASYTNCIIKGQFFNYASVVSFDSCEFYQTSSDAYNIWTYGASSASFSNCYFESAGKSVLIYNEGACGTSANVNSCEFVATSPVSGKAAIETDSSLMENKGGCIEVNISGSSTASGFGGGNVSGEQLWNNKKGDETKDSTTVNIGGGEVYPNPAPAIPNPAPANPAPTAPAAVDTSYVPATADNSNMPLWSALFIAFAAVALFTGKKRKA